MDNRPIGLLDSGLGGLSVAKKVIEKLPNESTVFIGDNAHMPYGDRTKEEIIEIWQNKGEDSCRYGSMLDDYIGLNLTGSKDDIELWKLDND